MKTATHRILVALHLPGPIGLLISFVRAVLLAMTGNPRFPSPTPPLATVAAAASDLETAQGQVKLRVNGAVATRAAKRAALVQLIETLRMFVQGIADADPANAAAIIESAGFAVRKVNTHGKHAFAVTHGAASGSVNVVAPAVHRASYEWQFSADGGKTWQTAKSTVQAKAVLTGFAPGSALSLRYRASSKASDGTWSEAIGIVVR